MFIRDPARQGSAFRTLERMQAAGLLRLCIPHVVEREVSAHLGSDVAECAVKLESAFNDLERRLPRYVQEATRRDFTSLVAAMRSSVVRETELEFERWLFQNNAVTIEVIAEEDTHAVLDGYFKGSPPFAASRSRQDFPDAFIFAAISRFAKSVASLHFVTSDKRLREACTGVPGVITWSELQHFLAHDAVAKLLISGRARLNLVELTPLLCEHHKDIERTLRQQLLDHLNARVLRSPRIPSAGHEATVAQWGPDYGLELLWEVAAYDGLNSILVPFCWQVEADLTFRVSRNVLASLSKSEVSRMSLSDLTSEELLAERLYDLTVTGDAVISLSGSLDSDLTREQLNDLTATATVAVEGRPVVELSDVQDRGYSGEWT